MFAKIRNKFTNNRQGSVLAISLAVVVFIAVLGSIFIVKVISEKSSADVERLSTQAFYIAEAANQASLEQIDTLINTNMMAAVNGTNPQVLANDAKSYVNGQDGLGFLWQYTRQGSTNLLTIDAGHTLARYNGSSMAFANGNYIFNILFTEKSNPSAVGTDQWDFPYYYRIEAAGVVGGMLSRKVVLTGDFTVRVQRDNFAKFALFTDHHTMPSGTPVWFTNKTNFSGPIHTNDQYRFALNPSGTFDGVVTQQNTKAMFYNNNNPKQENADSNPPYDVPTFNAGYTRGVAEIVLASAVQKQDMIDQARGGDNTPGNGIFVANDGTKLLGGIYVSGSATINMGVDGNHNAAYTITRGSTTKVITVDIANRQTSVHTVGGGTQVFNGLPDGVGHVGTIIYVNGAINSLEGTVQKDTEVTVSSENDIVITDNLKYEAYNPAVGTPGTPGYIPPNADDQDNMLGVVCWGGNVRVGTGAPENVEIHASVMARNGIFTVDNYDSGEPRGVATLLGGAITQFYGAFGTFNGQTGLPASGYGRNFVYDGRMLLGKAPPYYPSMKTFIAFTNDIADKIAWQEGGF